MTQLSHSVLLVESPFSARDFKRFGVRELLEAGLSVEVWDLSAFLLPQSGSQWIAPAGFDAVHRLSSLDDFRRMCRTLTASHLVITYVGCDAEHSRKALPLQRIWSSSPATIATVDVARTMGVSAGSIESTRLRALTRAPMGWITRSDGALATAIRCLVRPLLGIRSLDFVWSATHHIDINRLLVGPSTRIVSIHSFDYDLVLEQQGATRKVPAHAVMLDTLGPSHPDFTSAGATYWDVSAAEYFGALRESLDSLRAALGMDLEIAAHPRAAPGSMDEAYHGFNVRYGQTAQAIAEASIVVGVNASTSLGMAVALDRPILLIDSPSWPRPLRTEISRFARATGVPVWNGDKGSAPSFVRALDPSLRDSYLTDYVKVRGTPNEPFWRNAVVSLSPFLEP